MARGYMAAFQHPERLLSTAMMGVTIAHVVSSAVATAALLSWVGGQASLWATVILTPLMLVFGEILPKALTQPRATEVALRTFDPLRGVAWLLAPVVGVANLLVRAILRGLGHGERRDPFVSRADLRLLVEREPDGTTDVREEEREMIEGIFDLVETSAREVMVPLVDVIAIPEDASIDDAVAKIRESGHSRLPVYRERIDNVVGVVAALDILARGAAGETILTLMRPAHYVPATKRISDLLPEMQRRRIQLAVVVDEYGASQGIVTRRRHHRGDRGGDPGRPRADAVPARPAARRELPGGRAHVDRGGQRGPRLEPPDQEGLRDGGGADPRLPRPHPAAGRAGDRRRLRARGGGCRRATHPQGEDPGARAGGRRRPGPRPRRPAPSHARRTLEHDRQHGDISRERDHDGRLPRHAQERRGTRASS